MSSISEENLEPPKKKQVLMAEKTPVSNLFELASQHKTRPEMIELLSDNPELKYRDKSHKFWIKYSLLGRSALAGGLTKKSAQHSAAQALLWKINTNYDSSNDEDEEVRREEWDFISRLHDLCVLRNFHKPEFTLIDSYGKSHEPTFIYECKIDSLARRRTASNKNEAKQLSAKEVYEVLLKSFPDSEKKILLANEENLVKEETRKKITSYLRMRELNKVSSLGKCSVLSQRSSFLEEYNNQEFIGDLKEILKEKISIDEKYEKLVKELNTLWECRVDNFLNEDTGLMEFKCLVEFDQFSICLFAKKDELNSKVVNYFSEMLNVAI